MADQNVERPKTMGMVAVQNAEAARIKRIGEMTIEQKQGLRDRFFARFAKHQSGQEAATETTKSDEDFRIMPDGTKILPADDPSQPWREKRSPK